jgi:hypothetical protein
MVDEVKETVSTEKPKKKNRKWLWIGLGLVVLFIIGSSASKGTYNQSSNNNSTQNNQTNTAQEVKKFNIDDIYAKIQNGMTETQVKEIVTDPINCTESEMAGIGTSKICTYGNVFTQGGSIMVTYMNGKVNSKTKSQY